MCIYMINRPSCGGIHFLYQRRTARENPGHKLDMNSAATRDTSFICTGLRHILQEIWYTYTSFQSSPRAKIPHRHWFYAKTVLNPPGLCQSSTEVMPFLSSKAEPAVLALRGLALSHCPCSFCITTGATDLTELLWKWSFFCSTKLADLISTLIP